MSQSDVRGREEAQETDRHLWARSATRHGAYRCAFCGAVVVDTSLNPQLPRYGCHPYRALPTSGNLYWRN